MMAGIAAAVPGNHIGDIAAAVEDVAIAPGWGWCDPSSVMASAPRCTRSRRSPITARLARARLEVGLCLAIEPMFTLGRHEVRVDDDGWTVRTVDGGLAAHFEHSLAVTASGPEILTGVTDQRFRAS